MNDLILSKLAYIKESKVKEAILYSLLSNGKRLRPNLLYATVKGFNKKINDLDNFAIAIEMIHTYSLIHDDLPAMDNDDFRRGRKTCHIQFDEATAILAGDGLLNEAFNLISMADIDSKKIVKCINILANQSGVNGMIYGQILDMNSCSNEKSFATLKQIHHHKTGMLISVPLIMACILCDKEEYLQTFKQIGFDIGLAFQIQDDILDVTSSKEVLGKSNSDIGNNKLTSVSILGLNEARLYMEKLYRDSIDSIDNIEGFNSEYLIDLINKTVKRVK